MSPHYLTKEGHERLKDELQHLTTEERQKLSSRIEAAIAMGDLSENAEYEDAKNQQAFVEGRIAELTEILKNVVIIDSSKAKSEVAIGSTVMVKIGGKLEKEFTIVGPEESDPANGIISHQSPLGSAFLGHKKGDTFDVETPRGVMKYEILKIS